ncbi:lipid transferase CIDEA isoform X2 [Halichoeres trimaculatus]|uniref:lipid transferase CIDEA isoform X2 n=1 Tax=Halichoeres trimaculatus TaxID=147232 RepID=UPI003D9DE29A
MPPLSIQSGVTYVKTLLPEALVRSVSSLQTSVLPSAPSCSFEVFTHRRRNRCILQASSLNQLLEQSLPGSTSLMVLERGETWTQNKILSSFDRPKRNGIAKLTFDLYKLHPKDFLCCLAIKASLCDMYSLCFDFRCTRIKRILRSLLQRLTCLCKLTGHLLLFTSSSLLPLTVEDDS